MRTNALRIRRAADCLHRGGILAYPTEAVWGLGCDPFDREVVLRLLQIKNRQAEKGMILIAASMQQLGALLEPLDDGQRKQLAATWPGPVTWLLPDPQELIPWWIKGDHATVAVRVSAHPVVQALSLAFSGPLVSTSANIAGRRPATSRLQLVKQLGASVDHILNGPLGGHGAPSVIRDLTSGMRLR